MSMDLHDLGKLARPEYHIRFVQGVQSLHRANLKIIKAVEQNERVCIRACHGIGKTFTMSKIVTAFLSTHPYSKVITTAPTNRQVNHLLWSEIRRAHKNSIIPLGGKVLETPYWKIDDEWFAIGFSPDKGRQGAKESEQQGSKLQGFHAENMLVVIDEATGVPESVWEQIEGLTTSANVKIVAIGNPTTKNCRFYELFQSRAWTPLHLSIFDSPNLTANHLRNVDDLRRELAELLSRDQKMMQSRMSNYNMSNSSLVTAKWVMTRAFPEEWGIDSTPFRTRCLGEFPEVEGDVFFTDDLIKEACQREPTEETITYRGFGMDPARFGPDSSVLTIVENFRQTKRIEMKGKDTQEQAGRIAIEINSRDRVSDEKVVVDCTGVGGGVFDRLKELQDDGIIPKSVTLVEFHNGDPASEEEQTRAEQERDVSRYANKKAKAYDLLSQDMCHMSLNPVDHHVYKKELPTLIYDYDGKGRKKVESKEDYKARTGRSSPDSSESLAYANYGRYVPKKRGRETPRVWST